MKLTSLLGKKLKDETVLQLLEEHRAGEVVYEFDRLREGTPDQYWVEARDAGFTVWFDEHQTLTTIHCYVAPLEGFSPISFDLPGVPFFRSRDEAERVSRSDGLSVTVGEANVPALGLRTVWARVAHEGFLSHYEFRDGVLAMVSLSLRRP